MAAAKTGRSAHFNHQRAQFNAAVGGILNCFERRDHQHREAEKQQNLT
jgi:hypothetical protein